MIQRSVCLSCVVFTVLTLLSNCSVAMCSAAVQATFYVAPDGSDDNSGTEAKPFVSIEKAQQAVRAVNQQMSGDVVIVLRGSTYRIDRTVVFGPEDSGTNGHNVIYRAAPGETPIISGGKPVVGWQPDEQGRWKALAPVEDFRQLYVNGFRVTRARGQKPIGLELAGDDGYKTTAVEMANWKNPDDLEFCYFVAWAHTRCKVRSIQREGDRAIIAMLQPHFTHAKTKEGVNVVKPNSMYTENALELLDEPGEWYLDRPAKTVYYLPRLCEDMTKAQTIAPAVERLVELRGTFDQPVHNIQFEGITFEHSSWLLPNKIGLIDAQANFVVDRTKPLNRDGAVATVHNEYLKSPSSVVCHAAKSIRFERCTFARLGSGGIDLECGAQDNAIEGCRFYDISGTAVQVGDVLKDDHHPDDPRKIVKNNAVRNCYIHDCCVEYMGGVGVFVGYTEGTVIAHNDITRLPYSGISVGWGWGEEDVGGGGYDLPFKYDTPTPARNNRIECNHIHYTVQSTYDGGGIYTLGNMPGTLIRGNYIHDNRGGPGGIYLDEGSGFIEITGNLVYRVAAAMYYNNASQNRKVTCKEHGNFFGGQPTGSGKSVQPSDALQSVVDAAGLEPPYRNLLQQQHMVP